MGLAEPKVGFSRRNNEELPAHLISVRGYDKMVNSSIFNSNN